MIIVIGNQLHVGLRYISTMSQRTSYEKNVGLHGTADDLAHFHAKIRKLFLLHVEEGVLASLR